MNEKLTESDVELAAIEWLEELGYTYRHGSEFNRDLKQPILEDHFYSFLSKTYPHLPPIAIKEVVSLFTRNEGIELDYRNRDFHRKLSQGIDYSWKDDSGKEYFEHLYPIDFNHPENNEFLCVNQFPVIGKNNRRPDLLIFVNGLPLVLFEFKNPYELHATVENAYNQIKHYIKDIPRIFEYNEVTIASDGTTTLSGMYSSGREWFSPWKSVDGLNVVEDDFALHSLIMGLFPKERFLRYIRYFIFHEDHNGTLVKKGAKYHQFFGISFAIDKTLEAIQPKGDGRIGVIWHTQGAGKSISMAIYTGIMSKLPELKNPTIVVEVDRRDLDSQLYDNFVLASDLVGTVSHAESTDKLRKLLDREGGGVVFTTIEKFRLKTNNGEKEAEHPVLSTRGNIIVIADEAHRTQYGLLDGFAAHIRKALPNASFIGFTGTPVDLKDADTREVFGETIHVYDIKQSIEDKATVPIYYEPRMAMIHIANEELLEEAEEYSSSIAVNEANRMKWAALEDAAGADDRIKKVSGDILDHYLKRTETLPGKAMIVCMSRRNCVKMYDALTSLEHCPEIAVVMTGNISNDPEAWNPHMRTSTQQEAIKSRFKDPDDKLKMVIVRDMWLTGFDAPAVHTMYVDKVMHGHNLMQSIARVNRVFRDKPAGLIVDYIGISSRLKEATNKYTRGGGRGDVIIDRGEAMAELREQIIHARSFFPEDADYSRWRAMSAGDKNLLLSNVTNHIIRDDQQTEDFLLDEKKVSGLYSMVKSHKEIEKIAIDIIFIQHVGVSIRKLKYPSRDQDKARDEIKEMIRRSIESDEVVDIYKSVGVDRPDISILNEDFLVDAKEKKSGRNIKLEMLRQILNNEIRLRLPKNIQRYTSLREQVDKIIDRYHKNAIDTYTAIVELYEHARELQNEDKRKKELGLSDEELAFYDILARHKDSIKEYDLIKELVKKVSKAVVKHLELDWHKKESARAAIRLAVKKVLRGKVQISVLKEILSEVIVQAEGQYKEWPMVG